MKFQVVLGPTLSLALAAAGFDIIRVPPRRFLKSPADIPAAIEEIVGRFRSGQSEVSRQEPEKNVR